MAIADLQRLANVHYPVSGDLSADVSFHGSQDNPAGSGSAGSKMHAPTMNRFSISKQRFAPTRTP
jgi:hypothetical protein